MRVVRGEQTFLVLVLREDKEDECRAEEDRHDACGVRAVVALEECLLRARDDRLGVLRGPCTGLMVTTPMRPPILRRARVSGDI